MAIDTLKNVRVRGIACCVPDNIIKTDDLGNQQNKDNIEKFKKTAGILQRHCCTSENIITSSDLCYQAAINLMDKLSISPESIDVLIFVTQSPDYYFQPATACVLQHRLNLSKDCLAFDMALGCSGYIVGLHAAGAYLQSGKIKRVLLLAGEAIAHMSPESLNLFGEAGSATIIDADDTIAEPMNFKLETLGEGFRELIIPYGGYRHGVIAPEDYLDIDDNGNSTFQGKMDGIEVFNFSTREVPRLIREYYDTFQHSQGDFDLFFMHQASLIILNQIAKKLKIPKEKMPISIDRYGNSSSATIPVGICDYFNRQQLGNDEKEKHILACGFGIGLSLAVTSFSIEGKNCFPITTTNEAFDDKVL